jgi:hypothetical protein
MVFNSTFNNILVISWWSVLLVEETGVPGKNHWDVASLGQTLSQNTTQKTKDRATWIPLKPGSWQRCCRWHFNGCMVLFVHIYNVMKSYVTSLIMYTQLIYISYKILHFDTFYIYPHLYILYCIFTVPKFVVRNVAQGRCSLCNLSFIHRCIWLIIL